MPPKWRLTALKRPPPEEIRVQETTKKAKISVFLKPYHIYFGTLANIILLEYTTNNKHRTSGGVVIINVGGGEQALEPNKWKEGLTKTVEIPVDDPDSFELYVSWLYTKRLQCLRDTDDTDANSTSSSSNHEESESENERQQDLGDDELDATDASRDASDSSELLSTGDTLAEPGKDEEEIKD